MNLKTLFINYIKLKRKLDKAKIYKLIDNTNQNVYIGSTCIPLKYRLSQHKSDYNRFLKGIHNNVKSFEIIKNDDYKIELIEICNIKTKQELLQRERYFIENSSCLNKTIPGRSRREYKDDNKDKIKEYYIANKDEINIKRNVKIDCECGGKFTIRHKSCHFKTTKHQDYLKSNH